MSGHSENVLIEEAGAGGGYSRVVGAVNALMVSGERAPGKVPMVGEDGKVGWETPGEGPSGDYIPTAQKGAANGVAPLDASSKVPTENLPAGRIKLTEATTIYVATTGNDSNDGLTSGTPKATIQAAWNMLSSQYDLGGQTVTIQLADGTYSAGLIADGVLVGQASPVTIQGNTTTPANAVISVATGTAIIAQNRATVAVTGLSLTTASGTAACITAYNYGSVNVLAAMRFGAAGGSHMITFTDGIITLSGNYEIYGGAFSHIYCYAQGSIRTGGVITITVTGTPAFSVAFARAISLGTMSVNALTFSGGATGKRYDATLNAVINTVGGGANYFPGDAAGTTATGGQYA